MKLYKTLFWVFIAFTGLLACNPSVGNDALATHLAAPQLWIESGKIWAHPAFSQLQVQEMLTLPLLWLCEDPGSTLQYAFYVLVAVMLFNIPNIGKWDNPPETYEGHWLFWQWQSRELSCYLAAALWLACPMAYFTAQQHLSDTILTGFMVGSVYCLLTGRWYAAGFLAGIAAGVKPIGLAGCGLVVVLSGRHWWRALIPCIVAAFPWYVANYLVHGHALWPWMGGTVAVVGTLSMTDMSFLDRFVYTSMPWERGLDHAGRLGPWVLVMAPFIAFLPWRERWARCLGLYVVGMWLFWWWLGLWHERYMLSTVAVHYVAGSIGLCRVLNYRRVKK